MAADAQVNAETAADTIRSSRSTWRWWAVAGFAVIILSAFILSHVLRDGPAEVKTAVKTAQVDRPQSSSTTVDNRPDCSFAQSMCAEATAEDNPNVASICAMAVNCK